MKIVVDGQEYELQITSRKVVNDGATAVLMDSAETEALMERIKSDLGKAVNAVDYAAEQREYESEYESDEESQSEMEENAAEWTALSERLSALLCMGE